MNKCSGYGRLLAGLALLLLLVSGQAVLADDGLSEKQVGRYTRETVKKNFTDVVADVEFAISQFNYRLTGRNRVGASIAEMDGEKFKEATVLHFCNTQAAKEILAIDSSYLLHMPCRITVRERLEDNAVVVDARLLTEADPAMLEVARRVNKMMRDIVNYAVQD
ncbi:MAG: DUF302 domain-containing protein [Gammaproteobacteria bacterium]|nr:DUF302 domain-containing protein [Gammaproteobacteria bacterium]